MSIQSCCICSSLLDTYDAKTEKPIVAARYLPCCTRAICQRCIVLNPRYKSYCPYCQISTEPSSLPQGLRDPPSYSTAVNNATASSTFLEEKKQSSQDVGELPPAYESHAAVSAPAEKGVQQEVAPDVLHFLTPEDSLRSLALAYRVPVDALRRANNVFSDHLVQGRKTVLIPGEYYKGGVSLSPQPIEGEEEELRKSKVRRWMVACKVSEYDVALLYLEQTDYNLEAAIEAYREDERWEKEHPLEGDKGKKKKSAANAAMRRFVGASR